MSLSFHICEIGIIRSTQYHRQENDELINMTSMGNLCLLSMRSTWTHNPLATASPVLGWKARTTTPDSGLCSEVTEIDFHLWPVVTEVQHTLTIEPGRLSNVLSYQSNKKNRFILRNGNIHWLHDSYPFPMWKSYCLLVLLWKMLSGKQEMCSSSFPRMSGPRQPPSFCRLLTANLRMQPPLRRPRMGWVLDDELGQPSLNQPQQSPDSAYVRGSFPHRLTLGILKLASKSIQIASNDTCIGVYVSCSGTTMTKYLTEPCCRKRQFILPQGIGTFSQCSLSPCCFFFF